MQWWTDLSEDADEAGPLLPEASEHVVPCTQHQDCHASLLAQDRARREQHTPAQVQPLSSSRRPSVQEHVFRAKPKRLAQAPPAHRRRSAFPLLLPPVTVFSVISARETPITRLGTRAPALPAASVSETHVGHVALEGQEVEDASGDVCPPDDPGDRLRVDRVSGEQQAGDGDGHVGWEQQPGEADHQAGCQAMQKDVDEVVAPRPEAAKQVV